MHALSYTVITKCDGKMKKIQGLDDNGIILMIPTCYSYTYPNSNHVNSTV